MITDETKPEDFKNIRNSRFEHIKGWGIDADPKNDPTYPMKNRTDEEQLGYTWERPEQQAPDVEVLKSVERPNLTAVYGTTEPPSGVSGDIRRMAFKYSESSYGRWLPLMLADRVGVIEGLAADLKAGQFPDLFNELGLGAEWKYNRKNLVIKVAVTAAVSVALVAFLSSRKKKRLKN
jgi:hypothetical protein